MSKNAFLILLLIVLGTLLSSCGSDETQREQSLVVSDLTVAVGAVNESTTDAQTLTFSLTLLNQGETPVYVRGVAPRPVPALQQRLLNETTFLPIDQTIAPGETIEAGSQWLFQTPRMNKEEIDATFADGYFTSIQATVEMELSLSGDIEE